MLEQFQENSFTKERPVPVEIITAGSLDADEQEKVRKRLSSVMGRPLSFKYNVDTNLIGGIMIRTGGTVIDGSIHNRLSSLREELHQGKPSPVKVKRQPLDKSDSSHAIEVITAVPLGKAEEVKLKKHLADLLGHPVSFSQRVEPGVIGGMVIKIGDKTIDSSLQNELAEQVGEMMKREVK